MPSRARLTFQQVEGVGSTAKREGVATRSVMTTSQERDPGRRVLEAVVDQAGVEVSLVRRGRIGRTAGTRPQTARPADRRMRIGQLAERLGINPKTIRYYEAIGLLPEPKRQPSGYRFYEADDLERVAFIRRARQLGLRLDVIREILALRERGQRPCGYVLSVVRRQVEDIEERIAALIAARDQLTALLARAAALQPTEGARYCELLEHRDDRDWEAAVQEAPRPIAPPEGDRPDSVRVAAPAHGSPDPSDGSRPA